MIKLTDKTVATSSASGDNIFINRNGAIMQVGMSSFSPPIVPSATGNVIPITDSSDRPLVDLTVFGNTTQNGTPTPENPIDLDSVVNPVVRITGKNLVENTATTQTVNGVTFTVNSDGTITASGTATALASVAVNANVPLAIGNYIVSDGVGDYTNFFTQVIVTKKDGTQSYYATGTKPNFSISDGDSVKVLAFVRANVTATNLVFKPMIRLASITDSTYEPYKSQTLSIPYTLNGVGDVKDYVDFERGVLVRNTARHQLTSSMAWSVNASGKRVYTILPAGVVTATSSDVLCTHATKGSWNNDTSGTVCIGNSTTPVCGFATSDFATVEELKSWLDSQTDGVFIVVPLITPTEIPLTAEEIEAFKQLTTYKPVTTITNSEGAEMGVSYCADTKLYIDNKLASLVASATTTDTTEV